MRKDRHGNGKKSQNATQNLSSYVEQGDSYQAAGDIHIHQFLHLDKQTRSSRSKVLKVFGLIISILAGITAILTFLLNTQTTSKKIHDDTKVAAKDSLLVTGLVREKGTNKIIPNVWITADLIPGDTISTTSLGAFEFKVNGKAGEDIRIYVGAEGYTIRNEYRTLPQAISIYLEKK